MDNIFYNYDRVISYNAFLNFLVGERGVGKTFGASEFVTRQFIKKAHEFVYVRRYINDLEDGKKKFFKALINENKFPDNKLEVKGNEFKIDGLTAGYAMTLSTAHHFKSTNFPKVKYIIFDEFLIEKGQSRYLKNEVQIFLSMIETIARMRDVVVLCLGNATDEINPYFLYFNINKPHNSDIKLYKDGLILVQYMQNKAYREAKRKTKFGRIIEGTEYEDYAVNNNFNRTSDDFIARKTGNSKFIFSFIYKGYTIGVWLDYNEGKHYISKDIIKNGLSFATTTDDHKPNILLLSIAKKYNCWNTFITNFKLGNVYYENKKLENITNEVLKNIILRS